MLNITSREKMFYSPDEVATLLGVSRSTVDRMTNRGAFISKFKIGRARCGYRVADFNDWVAQLSSDSA